MTKQQNTVSFTKKLVWAILGVAVGICIGIGGLLFFQSYNPKDVSDEAEVIAASIVFERVRSQNEIVCASQRYNITEKAVKRGNRIPYIDVEIPLTGHSFWYRFIGTIKVGVDLSGADYELSGNKIVVTLDQPTVSSNTPDMEQSGVLEEHNNIFNPIGVQEMDEFRADCMQKGMDGSLEDGIMEEARVNAEANITSMITAATGDQYKVEFVWR